MKEKSSPRKGFRHWAWLLPMFSLAWHGVVLLSLRWVCLRSYGEGACLPEVWVCPTTFVILGVGGGAAFAVNLLGIWKLFREWQLLWCVFFVAFLFVPSFFISCFWVYALMFFLGWA